MGRTTPGNYVPLDVNYVRDVAVRRAGEAAELLFVRSLAYSKGAKSGGFIPDFDLPVVAVGLRSVPKRVTELVTNGLWVEVEGGWRIRSWSRWNDEHDALTSELSDSGVWGSHQRWHVKGGKVSPDCIHCANDHSDSPPIDPPTSPPTEVANSKGREGKGKKDTPSSADADAPTFDDFWQLYPRKVGRLEAKRVWDRAVKAAGGSQPIVDGLRRHLPTWQTSEQQFIPHGKTWLNGARWDDAVGGVTEDGELTAEAVEQILGRETFQLPSPPEGIDEGTPEWRAWALEERDRWREARARKAADIHARRAAS